MFVAGSTTEPLMIAIAFIGNGGAYLIKKNKTKQNWMVENIIFDVKIIIFNMCNCVMIRNNICEIQEKVKWEIPVGLTIKCFVGYNNFHNSQLQQF